MTKMVEKICVFCQSHILPIFTKNYGFFFSLKVIDKKIFYPKLDKKFKLSPSNFHKIFILSVIIVKKNTTMKIIHPLDNFEDFHAFKLHEFKRNYLR